MRRARLLALALVSCTPSPSPRSSPAAVVTAAPPVAAGRAAACGTCHAAIVAEQEASFHALAFSDRTFQASLALEDPGDRPFCTGCHAPDGTRAGVSCASCHSGDPHAGPATTALRARPDASCATCHEFTFGERRPELVQKTMSEHAASPFSEVTCTACHMPRRDGHRDHRFASGHDPQRIADALRVSVTRIPSGVHVSIATAAGHAFPTGDMFRRARLQVLAEGPDGSIVADAARSFGRTWNTAGPTRIQTSDTRIRGTWEGDLPLEAPVIAKVRWQVFYERIVAVRGAHERKASSDVVAEGEMVSEAKRSGQ